MFPLSSVNISNTWRPLSLFRVYSLNSHSFTTSISSLSKSSSQSIDDQHFLPWLNKKPGTQISTSLSIRNSSYGRGLFATENILAGDCLLKVPFTVQLTADNLPREIRSLLADDVGHVGKVALLVLHEQRLGQNSQWAPYISRLPLFEDMHSTIFWSSDELEMIRTSALYKETLKQKSQIEKDYQAVKLVSDRFPCNLQGITAEEFKYAFGLVTSRAWESSSGISLIPFADFINHDCMSESYVLGDNSNQHSEVIADCDYSPGDQVMISYGKLSNAMLLLDFGFTLSHNIYDQVQVELNIPQSDGLHEQKLELLKRYQTPTLNDINKFTSSWNYFTIKEVQTSRNGKGIPQSLRAFCRILSSNSHKELKKLANEASQGDGRLARYPLKNKNREIKAHQFLLSEISHLVEEHSAHIKLLDSKLSHLCEKNSLLRRRFAKDLLAGELRVLKSAQAWLKNYCITLSWN